MDNATTGTTTWTTVAGGGGGGGITLVTEAQKNAMTATAANGTLVYQTDEFKGIYAKESDGWRSQSGDTPITFIDVDNPPAGGLPINLDASHHTIYVHGAWSSYLVAPDPIELPDPSSCKGRIYRITVNNGASYSFPNSTVEEEGYSAIMQGLVVDGYIRLDKDFTRNNNTSRYDALPDGRMIVFTERWLRLD